MQKTSKFNTTDISFNILLYLKNYDIQYHKYQITHSALNKLTKFITIFVKTVFANACLISIYRHSTILDKYVIKNIIEIMLRGYEININNIKQDYDYITNPLNDFGKSKIELNISSHYYNFTEVLSKIRDEIIFIYGERKINYNNDIF